LKILSSQPQLRRRLWDNAHRLYARLSKLGLHLGPEPSPIIAVRFEQREKAFAGWTELIERGVYVNLVLPPATPDGSSLLRCSVSAGHTPEQIDLIGDAFADVKTACGLS
jgi:8-amino-7-oxononanoate synthase